MWGIDERAAQASWRADERGDPESEWASPEWESLDAWRAAAAAGGSRAVFAELQANLDAAEGAQLQSNRQFAAQLDAFRRAFALADAHPELYLTAETLTSEPRPVGAERERPPARGPRLDVAELAARSVAAELSMRLLLPAATIRSRAFEAARCHDLLPRLWARFRDGLAAYAELRVALDAIAGLPLPADFRGASAEQRAAAQAAAERLAALDDELSELAGTVPRARFRRRARLLRAKLDQPDEVAARHARALAQRRLTVESADDGMAWVTLYVSAVDAARIRARVGATATEHSGRPDEARTLDQLRADVATALLTGDGTPTAVRTEILVTIPALTLVGAAGAAGAAGALDAPLARPAELEGHGPIDDDTARRLFAEAPTFLRLATDPFTSAPLALDRTRYRVTAAQRRWLAQQYEGCTRPGCTSPVTATDLDHLTAWAHGGTTDVDNLAPTCRTDHTLKHRARFSVTRSADGTISWRSPSGHLARTEPIPARSYPDRAPF
ncbi:HNH endonuclease signature motif containing protein [Agromyces soli]|uniref:HNH endonuclease n=1 Tax=Agromyces soli TaxID=659012 RepID=A0ABY4ASN6_9MICO|nr:HNH endonuclease signature motif containing protein [Agromyces soli]UOE26169.1 HNH endonuclease [Agromyces soli]